MVGGGSSGVYTESLRHNCSIPFISLLEFWELN